MSRSSRPIVPALLLLALTVPLPAQIAPLPLKGLSLRFAVLGDTGTGSDAQYEVGKQLLAQRQSFPFEFAIMLGDNLYGAERAKDYENKFERPYKPLLDAGVKFYAALGNHDDPNQRMYKLFNMNGERYYSFKPKDGIRFFAIDSNYMDQKQVAWLEKELSASGSDWKIPYFHHPLYSSGETHGSNLTVREQLEPMFLKYGVDVVFSGHEHFYERIKPQKGITYFICGSSAKLRKGNISRTDLTAKGYDEGYAFMLIEIAGDEMKFQAITEKGRLIDSGTIKRREKATPTAGRR